MYFFDTLSIQAKQQTSSVPMLFLAKTTIIHVQKTKGDLSVYIINQEAGYHQCIV